MIYVYCETCGHAIDKIKERVDQYDIPGAREQKSIHVSEVYCKECAEKRKNHENC